MLDRRRSLSPPRQSMSKVAPSWMAAVIWAAPNCLPSIGPDVQWVSVTAPTLRRALNTRPRDGGLDAKSMSSRPPDRPLSDPTARLPGAGQDRIVLRTPVTATYLR